MVLLPTDCCRIALLLLAVCVAAAGDDDDGCYCPNGSHH